MWNCWSSRIIFYGFFLSCNIKVSGICNFLIQLLILLHLHGNDHTIEIRFVYVFFFILKGMLKDIESGIFSIYLVIVRDPIHFC